MAVRVMQVQHGESVGTGPDFSLTRLLSNLVLQVTNSLLLNFNYFSELKIIFFTRLLSDLSGGGNFMSSF